MNVRRTYRLTNLCIGTMENPIVLQSFGEEHYAGCTGHPPDSHVVRWLTVCQVYD